MSMAEVEVTRADEGRHCVYGDPKGIEHPAIITRVWGPQCVNLAYVNMDEGQEDSYGRKIARNTSCMHQSIQQAHGNYWRF